MNFLLEVCNFSWARFFQNNPSTNNTSREETLETIERKVASCVLATLALVGCFLGIFLILVQSGLIPNLPHFFYLISSIPYLPWAVLGVGGTALAVGAIAAAYIARKPGTRFTSNRYCR